MKQSVKGIAADKRHLTCLGGLTLAVMTLLFTRWYSTWQECGLRAMLVGSDAAHTHHSYTICIYSYINVPTPIRTQTCLSKYLHMRLRIYVPTYSHIIMWNPRSYTFADTFTPDIAYTSPLQINLHMSLQMYIHTVTHTYLRTLTYTDYQACDCPLI